MKRRLLMSLKLKYCRSRIVDCTILVVEFEMEHFRLATAVDKVAERLYIAAAAAVNLVWEVG